jgi:hypothetical protein
MKTQKQTPNKLTVYQEVEGMIISWDNNGTKTAGALVRKMLRKSSVKRKEKK